jgi:hypothetical protein
MDKKSYRILTLTAACMLFLSTTAQQAIAWPCLGGCPACYTCTPTGCEWQCGAGNCCGGSCCSNTCCNGACCGSGQNCCGVSCCSNICCNGVCCSAGQNCCGGSCCSNVCCDGVCCGAGQTCCNGTCCDSGRCCNGLNCCEEGQICCPDGSCAWPCVDGEPTGECDTSHNEEYECIGCVGLLGSCSSYTMRLYTGNEVRYCSGGCPGDCVQQSAVECYVEYECKSFLMLFYTCEELPSPPWPPDSGKVCIPAGPGACDSCVQNSEEWEIGYAYPRECQ